MAIDGTAFYVAITSMMLARTFHLTQDAYFFAAFFFAQFLLALTGIGFIAMPSMFVAFGIPEVAIATVIGIEPILDMCGTPRKHHVVAFGRSKAGAGGREDIRQRRYIMT